jgi:hypothetical protein
MSSLACEECGDRSVLEEKPALVSWDVRIVGVGDGELPDPGNTSNEDANPYISGEADYLMTADET